MFIIEYFAVILAGVALVARLCLFSSADLPDEVSTEAAA